MEMQCQSKRKLTKVSTDLTSQLPDEIIHFILFLMPLKERGKTMLLSHRWKDLWKSSIDMITNLNLDDVNIMGTDYSQKVFRKKPRMTIREKRILRKERLSFARRVEQILLLHKTSVLNSFKLRFHLDIESSHEIDKWIQIALSMRPMKVDINLFEFDRAGLYTPNFDELYKIPGESFSKETTSFIKYLSLSNCVCIPPQNFSGFNCLIQLQLDGVVICDQNIEYIISGSPKLERLSLICCWQLINLNIVGENLVLEHLCVRDCWDLERLEMNAVNLTTFEYCGIPIGFDIKKVPQLINVVIYTVRQGIEAGAAYALRTLSTDIPKLKSLLMHTVPIGNKLIPKRLPPPKFYHLEKLVLMISTIGASLFGFYPLLQTAPLLEVFELHLPFKKAYKKFRRVRRPSPCPLLQLKEVVFTGLFGSTDEIDFVKHLVANAKVIDTVKILPSDTNYCSGASMQKRVHDSKMAVELVGQQIEGILRPGAKLITS